MKIEAKLSNFKTVKDIHTDFAHFKMLSAVSIICASSKVLIIYATQGMIGSEDLALAKHGILIISSGDLVSKKLII